MEHLEFDMARYVVRLRAARDFARVATRFACARPQTSPAGGPFARTKVGRRRSPPSRSTRPWCCPPVGPGGRGMAARRRIAWQPARSPGRPQANYVASHIELQMFHGAGLAQTV